MRIKSIQVSAFGGFKEWGTGELDSNLIVVCGPNEIGKSTFFNLIQTLLYGWHPVTNNPYLPWEGHTASISAVIEVQSGEEIFVQRSLHNKAQGEVIRGEVSYSLGNKGLEFLNFLPQAVFTEVFFLTLEQLRFPHAGAWQELQDQLLGGQFVSFIKPVSGVSTALEDEANSLWRSDRRGKPIAKMLDEQILHLTQKRKLAYENEQKLRDIEQQLFSLRAEQEQLKERKIQLLAELNRADRLSPVKKKLERINELLEMAGNIQLYCELPVDPEKSLLELDKDLTEITQEISKAQEKREQFSLQKSAFGSTEQLFLAKADEIGEITKSYARIVSEQQAVSTGRSDLKRNAQRLVDYAANFLLGGWQTELEGMIKEIDEVELRAEITSFKQLETQYHHKLSEFEGIKARLNSGFRGNPQIFFLFSVTLILLGLCGIFWLGNTPLGFAAALLMLLGISTGIYLYTAKNMKITAAEITAVEQEVAKLKAQSLKSCSRIKKTLRGLPVTEQRLQAPDETLLVDLKNMKIFLSEKDTLNEKLVQFKARIQEYHDKVRALLATLKQTASGDLLKDLRLLENGLTIARERQITAHHASNELADVDDKLSELQGKRMQLEEEKKQLLDSLQSLPGVEFKAKINNLLQRREIWQQAQTLRKDLESNYADLSVIEKEIGEAEKLGETWFFSDRDYAAKKIEFTESEGQMEELKEEIARLETELKHLSAQDRVDDLEGDIQQLQKERKTIAVKRDRLILLKNILKYADRRFREEHQPDVLQKAGRFLEIITEGRYDRLYVKEDGSGLTVRSNYAGQLLNVDPPLSRGTLEQIYLALRLALTEHLDSGKEAVPLFLDEVLVNWDGVRLRKGLEILANLAEKRQVFLFTCHDWLLQRIQEVSQAKVIKLS